MTDEAEQSAANRSDYQYVYKVLRRSETVRIVADGRFVGSDDDLRDGFVHLSAEPQVHGTLARHFRGETGLFLGICPTERLAGELRWETSRKGDAFPHLYRPLRMADVAAIVPIPDERESWTVPEPPRP